jgi:hypothetical protein
MGVFKLRLRPRNWLPYHVHHGIKTVNPTGCDGARGVPI